MLNGLTDILFITNQDLVLFALWHGAPILLEDKVTSTQLFPVFLTSATDQPNVYWSVQSTVNYLEASSPTGRLASPYLDFPSSVFRCGYNTVWVVPPSYSSCNDCPPSGISSKIDSSENNIFAHCLDVQSFPSRHHSSLFCLWACVRRGFLISTQPFNPNSRSRFLIVLEHTWVPVASFNFNINKWIVSMSYTCEISIRRTLGMRDF